MKTVTIYVNLENEGVDSWRPVDAQKVDREKYFIPDDTIIPEGEVWQFQPGKVVRCVPAERKDGEEETLLAVESV
jgi:hypothetical protein